MPFTAPSTYTSISYMYLDALIFGIVAWYLDNIIIVIIQNINTLSDLKIYSFLIYSLREKCLFTSCLKSNIGFLK